MLEFIKNDWTTIIGWCLAIFSILYAFYESKKNRDLKELNRVNNWIFFQKTNNFGGTIQKALYKVR